MTKFRSRACPRPGRAVVRWLLTGCAGLLAACQFAGRAPAPADEMAAHQVHAPASLSTPLRRTLAGLPPVADPAATRNAYRGRSDVVAAGDQIFHVACARCHGREAEPTPEAPDLRRLDSACRRLQDAGLARRCEDDVDAYFLESVRRGKLRAGVSYMPAWDAALSAEAIWAVRTYLASRPAPAPRLLPTLDGAVPVGAAPRPAMTRAGDAP